MRGVQAMWTRLLIYILLSLTITLIILFGGQIVSDGPRNHVLGADYIVYLLGSTLLAQGHGPAAEMYSLALQASTQQHILLGSSVSFGDGLLAFVHPPYVAVLALPLYYLSPLVGFALWDVAQLLMVVFSLRMLADLLPPADRYLLWLGAFAFLPLYQNFIEGQISPMMLLSVTLFWRALRSGGAGNWWAGPALGLGLVKPHLLLLFLLYLLFKRNWRALASFGLFSVAIYLITALVSGFDWPFVYLNTISWLNNQTDHYGMIPQVMFNWHGLLVRFNASSLLLPILTVISIAALIYAWWRSSSQPDTLISTRITTLELQLAATTLGAVITSIYLYTHDLTMLLFSGAVLLGWAAEHGWPQWVRVLLLAALITPFTFFDNVRDVLGPPLDTSFILVMLIALGVLLYLLIQPHRYRPPSAEGAS